MLIDCDTCAVRGPGCRDCVMTVILANPAVPVEFDDAEHQAVDALAAAGLVPPLRLVPRVDPRCESRCESGLEPGRDPRRNQVTA
jgi:hypothetical protein